VEQDGERCRRHAWRFDLLRAEHFAYTRYLEDTSINEHSDQILIVRFVRALSLLFQIVLPPP
jgi:hypothetical protein